MEVTGRSRSRFSIQSFERACDAALEPDEHHVYLETLSKRME